MAAMAIMQVIVEIVVAVMVVAEKALSTKHLIPVT